MHEINYVGKELALFQHAVAWKKYYSGILQPFLKGRILEAGAGIGSTTSFICDGSQPEWICLEPDPQLYSELENKIIRGELPGCCVAVKGTITDIPTSEKFHAILYIDVIEHIEKDGEELAKAAQMLEAGGYLVVLVPAHPFLYSPFDKAIGHYRRYNKKMLREAGPSQLQPVLMKYLDSVGMMASVTNKWFLKQPYPSLKQIRFWDRVMIPFSKVTDVLTAYRLGKTLVAVWKKNTDD